jgi:glycosyltransferase involved in cell wall biosynthesis
VKIIYLHQYFLTPDMAGGTRSYELARRLVRAGHDVHMITSDQSAAGGRGGWRHSVEDGIQVHWAGVPYNNHMGFAARVGAFLTFAAMATRRAARLDGEVIFATSTPLTIAIPAILASWRRRVPFVFEVRDMWPDVPIAIGALRNPVLKWAARRLELLAYRRATHVVALAPGMRDDIVRKGIVPGKISVIPNGCDLDVFGASAAASPRDEHAWLGRRRLVLFAGTIGRANGVEYLAHVAREALALDPELRFAVIGSGRERDAVRAAAADLGVLERNFFMLDAVPKRELSRWLHAADMIVALFTGPPAVWKDAVQNKFFDALAAGKPVASNFDGWQTRVAAEAEVGLMLPPADPAAGARALIGALADERWLSGVAARAHVLAHGRFNRDLLARDLERVLGAAVASGP